MSAYTPVPSAPEERRGWDTLEGYLMRVRLDVEWGASPDYETLGRLTALRLDLDSDLGYLQGLRDDLDQLIVDLSALRRDADYQEARDAG